MTKLRSYKKMGLTQKEVLQIVILQMISQTPAHAAEIYRKISENSRRDPYGPTRSRTYVYKTIEELEIKSYIQYEKQGRKKIFFITEYGKNFLHQYHEKIYPTLRKLATIIDHMLKTVNDKKKIPWKASPSEHEKKYLSKLVNVKKLVRWYTLHRLREGHSLHGGYLYTEMKEWFGWMSNHGYFYQVLREMNHEELLTNFWVDEDTRSQRGYDITQYGMEQYDILSKQLQTHLKEVQQALQFMIKQMAYNE